MPRTIRREGDIKRLYEEGYSDEDISTLLGISIWTVRHWRRKYNLKANLKRKVCKLCGAEFLDNSKAKYCPECRRELKKVRGIKFQIIKKIRYHLYYLMKTSPKTFYKVLKEMEREEGPEFVRLLTKGMISASKPQLTNIVGNDSSAKNAN